MSDSNPARVTSEIAVAALDDDAPQRRGGRFKPGNPGKPKGARHKTTLAIEALLDGEAEALTRKAIELAKAGARFAITGASVFGKRLTFASAIWLLCAFALIASARRGRSGRYPSPCPS